MQTHVDVVCRLCCEDLTMSVQNGGLCLVKELVVKWV